MNQRKQIRSYLATNFLFIANGFPYDDDTSLLEAGVVDSTGVLELILFVEERFKIAVGDNEVTPENFDSVSRIAAYVERKVGVSAPAS